MQVQFVYLRYQFIKRNKTFRDTALLGEDIFKLSSIHRERERKRERIVRANIAAVTPGMQVRSPLAFCTCRSTSATRR